MSRHALLIPAAFWALFGIFNLWMSTEFWVQLRTYSWKPVTATVSGSQLAASREGKIVMGDVYFLYSGSNEVHTASEHLFESFRWGDVKARSAAFVRRYALGTRHTAYLSPSGEVSLGHFPRSDPPWRAATGLGCCLISFLILRKCRKRLRSTPAEPQQPHE